jgi:hypothetical protein
VLSIDLAKGGTISALVSDRTQITVGGGCAKGDRQGRRGRRHGRWAKAARRGFRHAFGGHHGEHHGWWHHGRRGSSDDLVPGTAVDDAVLVLVDGTAVYAEVDLEPPPSGSAD